MSMPKKVKPEIVYVKCRNCKNASDFGDNSAYCKAKGAIGCWIVLAERGEWNGDTYPIKEVKAFEVDGKKVKADTWYMLVNGQLKEV